MANEPLLGAVFLFAGNFAPKGFMFCAGQVLPISQNAALFSILGTTYGGNGVQTFALPDLRSRVPVGAGQGQGLADVTLGQAAGAQTATILASNMPSHNHLIQVNSNIGAQGAAPGNFLASATTDGSSAIPSYETTSTPGKTLNPQAVSLTGNGVPLSIQNPYLGLNYIIAMQGVFPSRN